jgi:hypothetical protein
MNTSTADPRRLNVAERRTQAGLGKDYVYALVPLLVAADGMHHSEAHGAGYRRARRRGCLDAMVHLLNLVWPNIFESPPT